MTEIHSYQIAALAVGSLLFLLGYALGVVMALEAVFPEFKENRMEHLKQAFGLHKRDDHD